MRSRSRYVAATVSALLVACGSHTQDVPAPQATSLTSAATAPALPAQPATPDPIAKGAPHGAEIVLVGVSEERDAALTADASNSLRLWPALDGSRPPVAIAFGSEPSQLAIAHAGRELVAIVRDRGGALTLIRLGLDGSLRGKTQLRAPDAAFVDVRVSGAHILARTDVHTIEWYSVDGVHRGRLDFEPGQRITDLAVRDGRLAAVTTGKDGAALLRQFSIGGDNQIRWQPVITLPIVPRPGMLALAPSRDRIAFVDDQATGLHVLDLAPLPKLVPGSRVYVNAALTSVGFLDDDTVGVAGHAVAWWQASKAAAAGDDPTVARGEPPSATDPAATDVDELFGTQVTPVRPSLGGLTPIAAFARGTLVTATSGSLVLADLTHARYLGWRTSGAGALVGPSDAVVIDRSRQRFTWLDDRLEVRHSFDIRQRQAPHASWAYGVPIGERHILVQTHEGDGSYFSLIDVEHPDQAVDVLPFSQGVETSFPSDNTVAIKVGRQLRRFKFDLDTTSVTEMLPAIRTKDYSLMHACAFDPALAGGLVAVTVGWPTEWANEQALTYYYLRGAKLEHRRVKSFNGTIFKATPDGRLFVYARTADGPRIQIIKNGEVLRTIERGETLAPPFAVNDEGTRVAIRDVSDVVMFDETGAELWRTPLWGTTNLIATRSGERIVAAVLGGLVALDAATGAPVTRECGFEFGLHDDPPAVGPPGFATVCEDPIVP